ncbi:C2H2-type zinc finger protein [Endozoicomonas sp.]|uniref:C2H2-type zinc finger protein n=1 Tax=Endozoicomonas sp. TaxID=1892382 RepID=UPI00383A4B9E
MLYIESIEAVFILSGFSGMELGQKQRGDVTTFSGGVYQTQSTQSTQECFYGRSVSTSSGCNSAVPTSEIKEQDGGNKGSPANLNQITPSTESQILYERIVLLTGKTKYRCKICEREVYPLSRMKAHITCHSDRLFVCDKPDCTGIKSYKSEKDLKHHERRMHSNKRIYQCDLCDYSGNTLSNLKQHMFSDKHIDRNKAQMSSIQEEPLDLSISVEK